MARWKLPNPRSFGPALVRAFADLARFIEAQRETYVVDATTGGMTLTTTPTQMTDVEWTADKDYEQVIVLGVFNFRVTATGTGFCRGKCYLNGSEVSSRQALVEGTSVMTATVAQVWELSDVKAGDDISLYVYRDGAGGTYTTVSTHGSLAVIAKP